MGSLSPLSSGLLIYACYGMWHSSLELDVLEQQAHASSYQRYDQQLDEAFSADQDQDERSYQGWAAPEERCHGYQQQPPDNQDGADGVGHLGLQARSGGRTNRGFDMED